MAAVALCVFVLALPAIGARASYGAHVTADEPQYLTTAISVFEDFDLDISDELAERRFEPFHEIDLNPQTIPLDDAGRRVSPHDPLLPALLALPMGLGGWVAAKAALAAVAAATAAATLWLAVRRFGVDAGLAAVVTGLFFAAPPLVGYATQVYPEMPAALLVTLGLAAVTGPLLLGGSALAVASIVALPWLSVKFVPAAAVLAVVLTLRLWPQHRRRLVSVMALLAVAGVAYLAFHRSVYGGWTAYASGDHFVDGEMLVLGSDPDFLGRSRRLVGLLVDRGFGIAAWNPAYLLTAPALVALARRRPPGWAVLLAVFATVYATATWAALTMHGWWWPGRQVVAALPVVVVAAALLLERLRGLRWLVAAGCLAGIFNWLWLVVESSTGRRTLIVDFEETANPVYQAWSALLPDHRRFTGASTALTAVWTTAIVAAALLVWLKMRPSPPPDSARTSPPGRDPAERVEPPTLADATLPARPDPDAGR